MATTVVSLKAGIASSIDGVIVPDPRKGQLRVVLTEEDGLVHFQWGERSDQDFTPEVDFVIFPDEADFQQVDQPGARVVLLKFKHAHRQQLFFWMQEPDANRDAELCSAVQEAINIAGGGGASDTMDEESDAEHTGGQSAGQLEETGPLKASDLASMLAAMQPPPAESQPSAQPPASSTPAVSPEFLASILAGVVGEHQAQPQLPSLSEILTPQNVVPLLQDEAVQKRLAELVEHFPPEHQAEASSQALDEVMETWRSPQLQNQLRTLSAALASGQLDFTQFGLEHLGYSAADFLQSIQNKANSKRSKQGGSR